MDASNSIYNPYFSGRTKLVAPKGTRRGADLLSNFSNRTPHNTPSSDQFCYQRDRTCSHASQESTLRETIAAEKHNSDSAAVVGFIR